MVEQAGIVADMRPVLAKVRRLARALALAVVGMYLLSGFYVVEPDERGVVRRFGRVVADDVEPGIHYRLPWPIEAVDTPKVTSIRRMSVGYRIVDQIRGVSPEAAQTQFVTGDTNVIEIQLLVQYVVKDASSFLYMVADPQWLVGGVCESVLAETVAGIGVDEALTTAKLE
jgi:membrane protease subunit HflK